MPQDDDARAAQYRADHTEGASKRSRDQFYGQPGDPDAKAELEEEWQPWINPERDWDPAEETDDKIGRQLL